MLLGCRETAFIYSITSAALVYTMVKECARGSMKGCSKKCILEQDQIHPNNLNLDLINGTHGENEYYYAHKHCDDDLDFGFNVWREFVLIGERSADLRARFNRRNSLLGVQVGFVT